MSLDKLNCHPGPRGGRPRARRPRQGARARDGGIRAGRGPARPALPAARQRRRVPADERQQLPVAVAPPGAAARGGRGRARVRHGAGRRAVHRRHVGAPRRRSRRASPAFTGRPAAKAFNSAYTTDPRHGHHAHRARHVLDWRRAEPQLHHPRDAHRQRAERSPVDLHAQRRRRSRAAARSRSRRRRARHRHLRRHLQHARRRGAARRPAPRDRRARPPLPRRRGDDDGRFARHRRVRRAPDAAPRNTPARAWTCWSARSARPSA